MQQCTSKEIDLFLNSFNYLDAKNTSTISRLKMIIFQKELTGEQVIKVIEKMIEKISSPAFSKNEYFKSLVYLYVSHLRGLHRMKRSVKVSDDWKQYHVKGELFTKKFAQLPMIAIYILLPFFKKEDVIKQCKKIKIGIEKTKIIYALLNEDNPAFDTIAETDEFKIINMYKKMMKNEEFTFDMNAVIVIKKDYQCILLAKILIDGLLKEKKDILDNIVEVFQILWKKTKMVAFFDYFLQLLHLNKDKLSKETKEFLRQDKIVDVLFNCYHSYLFIKMPIFSGHQQFSLHHLLSFFGSKMKTKIMNVINYKTMNEKVSVQAQVNYLLFFIEYVWILINHECDDMEVSEDEIYFYIQTLVNYISNHICAEIIQPLKYLLLVSWELIRTNISYEKMFEELLLNVLREMFKGTFQISTHYVDSLPINLLCTEEKDYHEMIANMFISLIQGNTYNIVTLSSLLEPFHLSTRYSHKIAKYCLRELITDDKMDTSNEERIIMLLHLLKTSINFDTIKQYSEKFFIIMTTYSEKATIRSVIKDFSTIFTRRLMEYKCIEKQNDFDDLIQRFENECIFNYLNKLPQYIEEKKMNELKNTFKKIQVTAKMLKFIEIMDETFMEKFTSLLLSMSNYFLQMKEEVAEVQFYISLIQTVLDKEYWATTHDRIEELLDDKHWEKLKKYCLFNLYENVNETMDKKLYPLLIVYLRLSKSLNRKVKFKLNMKQRLRNPIPIDCLISEKYIDQTIQMVIYKIEEIGLQAILDEVKKLENLEVGTFMTYLLSKMNSERKTLHFENPMAVFRQLFKQMMLTTDNCFHFTRIVITYISRKKFKREKTEDFYLFIEELFQRAHKENYSNGTMLSKLATSIINIYVKRLRSEEKGENFEEWKKEHDRWMFMLTRKSIAVLEYEKSQIFDCDLHDDRLMEIVLKYVTPELIEKYMINFVQVDAKDFVTPKSDFFSLICFNPFQQVKEIIEKYKKDLEGKTVNLFYLYYGLSKSYKIYNGEEREECFNYIVSNIIPIIKQLPPSPNISVPQCLVNDEEIMNAICEKCLEELRNGNSGYGVSTFIIYYLLHNPDIIEEAIRLLLSNEKLCLLHIHRITEVVILLIENSKYTDRIIPIYKEIIQQNTKPHIERQLNASLIVLFNSLSIITRKTIDVYFMCLETIFTHFLPFENIDEIFFQNNLNDDIIQEYLERIYDMYLKVPKTGKLILLVIVYMVKNNQIGYNADIERFMNIDNDIIRWECSICFEHFVMLNNFEKLVHPIITKYNKLLLENDEKKQMISKRIPQKIKENDINNNNQVEEIKQQKQLIDELLYITCLKTIVNKWCYYIHEDIKEAIHVLLHFKSSTSQISKLIKETLMNFNTEYSDLLKLNPEYLSEEDHLLLLELSAPWYFI